MMTQCPDNILFAKDTAIGIHRINCCVITVKHSAVFVQCYTYELKNKLRNKWKSHFLIILMPTMSVKSMLPVPSRRG